MALCLLEHYSRVYTAAGAVEIASERVAYHGLKGRQFHLPDLGRGLDSSRLKGGKTALSKTPEFLKTYGIDEDLFLAGGDEAEAVGLVVVAGHLGDEG